MPGHSKRQKQLGVAREAKHQKREEIHKIIGQTKICSLSKNLGKVMMMRILLILTVMRILMIKLTLVSLWKSILETGWVVSTEMT